MDRPAWEELMEGSASRAAQMFQEAYKYSGSLGDLHNLGLALLEAGNYDAAKRIFSQIVREEESSGETTDLRYIYLGICDWLIGALSEAIDSWHESFRAEYADDAGGVAGPAVLWYATVRTRDEGLKSRAEAQLRRICKPSIRNLHDTWPGSGAVAAYILGLVGKARFLDEWKSPNPVLESRRQVRAHFWCGVKEPDDARATEHFCAAACAEKIGLLEY